VNNKSKVILLGILATLVVSFTSIDTVFAWHDFGQSTWATPNNAFLCNSNLSSLTTQYVNPCQDAITQAAVWNAVPDSEWRLTFTSGTTAPIHLSAGQLTNTMYIGESMPLLLNGRIVGGDIMFSTSRGFTDATQPNSNTAYYDFKSVALHELGHLQWVGHEIFDGQSVMASGLEPNTVKRTLSTHDKEVLATRY